MVVQCCVPRCPTRGNVSRYFRVPFTNQTRLEAWLTACSFLKRYETYQLESVRFCARHFTPECINEKQRLTADATPTLNLPVSSISSNARGSETTKSKHHLIVTPIQSGKDLEIKVTSLPPDPNATLTSENVIVPSIAAAGNKIPVAALEPVDSAAKNILEAVSHEEVEIGERKLSTDGVLSSVLPASGGLGTVQPEKTQQHLLLKPIQQGKDLEIKVARFSTGPKATLDSKNQIGPIVTVGGVIAVGPTDSAARNISPEPHTFSPDASDMQTDVDEEPAAMWDVRACRGCLAVKGKLEKISDGCKRLYTSLTGLQIAEGDGYPHYFCLECRTMLKKCLAFRRKSRRAHFVMKEIMTVRKQVTYSDIITVNRKKTNLDSSLGFWDPQKTCSLVMKEDEDPQPDGQPTGPFNTRVLDIKPDIDPEEERPVTPIENINDAPDDMDNTDIDFNIKDELFDIDLNDVFKDLNENETNVDEVVSPEPELDVEEHTETNEPDDPMSRKVNKYSIQRIVNALRMCDIRVLSLEEQQKRMDIRKLRAPFIHALFKCAMCLTIHRSMEELVAHVAYHNKRRYDHECVICRNKYPRVEDLNIHVARCHMYEYKCKCGIKRFSLHDIVKHSKTCEGINQDGKRPAEAPRDPALKCFMVVSLTQRMMQHVRVLRPSVREQAVKPAVITNDDFQCDICGEWVKEKENLERHMTTHRFLYTCRLCNEVFTERRTALVHGEKHQYEKTWACPVCDKKFISYQAMNIHRITSHREKHTCNLCGNVFRSIGRYYKHQLTEHKYISLNDPLVGDPEFECGDCSIQFTDRQSLETHLVTMNHTGASEVEFACVPCKKIFEDEQQLETHLVICGNHTKYPRKCCYCSETLMDKHHYKTHYVNEHPMLQYVFTSGNAICDICGKLVKKTRFEAHLKMHAGESYVCRLCGFGPSAAAAHVAHVLCYHSTRPYCCALCPRRYQNKGDCRDHILKVHAPAKLYKCEFCAQEFSYFRNLREHSEKLHNLVIPAVKNQCKKSKTKIFVYAHMKIDINELERPAVEKAEIALLDYLDQKSKPVDYKDFFTFSEEFEQIFRKQKKTQKPKEIKVPKIEIESNILIKPSEVKYEDEIEEKIDTDSTEVTGTEVENAVRNIVGEGERMEIETEDVKDETQDMVIDEEKPLEVFENDGNQFVMIGGELYRIACDDEE